MPSRSRLRQSSSSSWLLVSNSEGVTAKELVIAVSQYCSSAICSNWDMTFSGLVNS